MPLLTKCAHWAYLLRRSFASNRSVRVTVQVRGSVLRILGCVLCGNGEPLLIRSMIWPTSPKLSQISSCFPTGNARRS